MKELGKRGGRRNKPDNTENGAKKGRVHKYFGGWGNLDFFNFQKMFGIDILSSDSMGINFLILYLKFYIHLKV